MVGEKEKGWKWDKIEERKVQRNESNYHTKLTVNDEEKRKDWQSVVIY